MRLASGAYGRAIAPAGASTGSGEAIDRRDGGERFGGFDVRGAVEAVRTEIAPLLANRDGSDQDGVDRAMIALDGTPNKSRLGANAIVATSMAVLHAASADAGVPLWRHLAANRPVRLPVPEIQIFGGGAHAARRVDVQDFMVVCLSARTFAEALDNTAEVYRAAGSLMKRRGSSRALPTKAAIGRHSVPTRRPWRPWSRPSKMRGSNRESMSRSRSTWRPPNSAARAVYELALTKKRLDTGRMIELLSGWLRTYPIISIEDPLAEDDAAGLAAFTAQNGARCQIIGDDFLVTNAARVEQAAADRSVNAVLIKPNQAGR